MDKKGRFSPSRFAFLLKDWKFQSLRPPIPAKGAVGIVATLGY
jgi:hypothetical protein